MSDERHEKNGRKEVILKIKSSIKKGELANAINFLEHIDVPKECEAEYLLISSMLKQFETNQVKGILSIDEIRRTNAIISDMVLKLINAIDSDIFEIPNKTRLEEKNDSSGGSSNESNKILNRFIGILILFGIIILLILTPCPTSSQFYAFRLALAVATGLLVSQMPGILNYESKSGFSIGGAIGVFVLVLLVNPSKSIGYEKCAIGSFSFSIQLKTNPELSIPLTYPELEAATVELWIDNVFRPNDAMSNKTADFKSIPYEKKGQTIPIQLKARYWKLAEDSINLTGKGHIVLIEPNGSLSEISGKVIDGDKGKPIPNVIIESLSEMTQTDELGNFTITMPLKKQRIEYEIYANKDGFESWKGTATPATGAALNIVLNKE